MERTTQLISERLLAAIRAFLGINDSHAIAQLVTDRLEVVFDAYLLVAHANARAHLIEAEGKVMARLLEAKAELIKAEAYADLVRHTVEMNARQEASFSSEFIELECEEARVSAIEMTPDADIMRALDQLRELLADHFDDYEGMIEQPLVKLLPAGPNA